MNTIEKLRERLARLDPERIDIRDDGAAHAGHAGARDGGHFSVLIVSPRFSGLSILQRHRLVYDAVGDMMKGDIHALSINAQAPEDFSGNS